MRRPLIFCLALLLCWPWPAAAGAVETLVARVLAAHGGPDLPDEGALLISEGRIRSDRLDSIGRVRRAVAWPDYLSIEISHPGHPSETRLMIGDRGWRDGAPASGPLLRAMRLQAARLALPMLLDWERGKIADLGPATRGDGRAVRRLRVDLGSDLALFVEIGMRSARILRSAGVMTMGGGEMSFGAAYGPLRAFGPLRLPARETQSAMGRPIGWTEIDRVAAGLAPASRSLQP